MSNSFEAFVAATHPKSPSMTKEVTFGSGSVVSLRKSTGLTLLDGFRPTDLGLFGIRQRTRLHEPFLRVRIDDGGLIQERRANGCVLDHVVNAAQLISIGYCLGNT